MTLSERCGIELPICSVVYRILYEDRSPQEEIDGLFMRSLKPEF